MTRLTDIIEINISRETQAVAQTNFNIPLFMASHTNFTERAREYTTIEAVAEDFATTSNVYLAASKMFSQQLRPARVVIGRRQVPGATINVSNVVSNALYTMTVNGTAYSFSMTSATAIDIAAGLKVAYDANDIEGITLVDNLDGTLTFSSTVDWSILVSANLVKANAVAVEPWTETLEEVQQVNNTWYAMTAETHLLADVLALAGAIEAKKKIYGTSTSALNVKTTATDDLLSQLQDLGYQRTFVMWCATADTQFPEAAWVGYQLQEQPGSNTWSFKGLSGVTVSNLSDTESTNIKNKNGNTYEVVGGVNRTIQGKMVGGEWIDVMVFVDWLEARMTERIWFRMANAKKIPYTQAGATIIEAEVRAQLRDGIRNGGLAEAPAPVVIVPDILSIAPNLRAQRIFEGITFEARLAGAIHFVKIRGTVTV